MFEPENDLERQLMHATAKSAARSAFARALMDAQVFVVLLSDGALPLTTDGRTTIPAGTKLSLATARRDRDDFIPFFTARSRARTWFKGDHVVAPDRTRDLFSRHPGTHFILNPGSDFAKEFLPDEVNRMLAGQFDEAPQTLRVDRETEILLAHPKEPPAPLISALARELGRVNGVQGAWLMLAATAGATREGWMLGVDCSGDWADVRAAIARAVSGEILQGRTLDAMQLSDNELGRTLRKGIPVLG